MSNKHYDSPEAAEYLGISLSTLYRMERRGIITPMRTAGGHRRFTKGMMDDFLSKSSTSRPVTPQQPSPEPIRSETKSSPAIKSAQTSPQPATLPRFIIPEPDFETDEGKGDWEPPQSQHILDLRRA